MIKAAAIVCLVFLAVGCATPEKPTAPAGPGVSALALPVPGRAKQASSWDRTGGNFDTRVVEPGQTITILAERRPGAADLFLLALDRCPP